MKKFMQRISAVSMALVLALGLASCAKDGAKTGATYETYKAAVEKTAALKDVNCTMDMNMTVEAGQEKQEVSMAMLMQMKSMEEQPEMNISMDIKAAGESQTIGVYYKDGVAYMDMAGIKQKGKADMDDLKEQLGGQTEKPDVELLEESLMKNAEYKNENGGVVVTVTVPASDLEDSLSGMLGMLGGAEDFDGMMNFEDVTIQYVINSDGYVAEMNMDMSMSMTASGESGSVKMAMKIKFVDPGKEVTVTAPKDLDSYTDMDA